MLCRPSAKKDCTNTSPTVMCHPSTQQDCTNTFPHGSTVHTPKTNEHCVSTAVCGGWDSAPRHHHRHGSGGLECIRRCVWVGRIAYASSIPPRGVLVATPSAQGREGADDCAIVCVGGGGGSTNKETLVCQPLCAGLDNVHAHVPPRGVPIPTVFGRFPLLLGL